MSTFTLKLQRVHQTTDNTSCCTYIFIWNAFYNQNAPPPNASRLQLVIPSSKTWLRLKKKPNIPPSIRNTSTGVRIILLIKTYYSHYHSLFVDICQICWPGHEEEKKNRNRTWICDRYSKHAAYPNTMLAVWVGESNWSP